MNTYVGGLVASGTVNGSYNIGNVYNIVQNPMAIGDLYTGPIAGSLNSGSSQNAYLDSIQVVGGNYNDGNPEERIIGQTMQTALTEEYMKSEDYYNTLKNNTTLWQHAENNYPTLDIASSGAVQRLTRLTVENTKKKFDITAGVEVNSQGGRFGGTTSGDYTEKYTSSSGLRFIETLEYGKNNTNDIVLTPSEGYMIAKITINGVNIAFEVDEEAKCTIPAGYFSNITENKTILVTFELKDAVLTINKVDDNNRPVEGAEFYVEQQENRTPPDSGIIGELTGKGPAKYTIDTTINENELLGPVTKVSSASYQFVSQSDGTYKSNNNGVNNGVANSYVKIDLTGKQGTYVAVVNATVSSERNYDIGYATITNNSNAPAYNNTNGRFMFISGEVPATDYTSGVLTGGNIYYLHLGYRKDTSSNSGSDALTINSINLYGSTEESYGFIKQNDKYVSTNQGMENTDCQSYVPIDLTNYVGKYKIIVNAEMSGKNYTDYGSVYLDGSDISTQYLMSKTGIQTAQDYSVTVDGGKVYNLYFRYYKYSGTDNDHGDDKLTINSIRFDLDSSDFYRKGGFTTDSNGKIILTLKHGLKYKVIETSAPDNYIKDETSQEITLDGTTDGALTFVNDRKRKVTTHYYLARTGAEYGNDAVELSADVEQYGALGTKYQTRPILKIGDYTLAKENDEYVIPENASGEFQENDVDVYYYYEEDLLDYNIHYIYNNEEDVDALETESATLGTVIDTYTDKNDGTYELERVENLPLTVGKQAYNNNMYIYYTNAAVNYEVHYFYDGVENGELAELNNTAFVGDEVGSYTDKVITGYKLDRAKALDENGEETELPLVIKADESKNVINVYYVKDNFEYTVHYFYDGEEDTSKIDVFSALYESEITNYVDKNITGYKLDKAKALDENGEETDLPLIIKTDESKNVVNVYYVKDSFNYTVHYFYDGTEDESKKETLSAVFGSSITEVPDKNITGYKHDRTETLPLTIGANAEENVVNVYYVKDSFNYTVHYFYDGTEDTAKKETLSAIFGSSITEVPDKNITGYKHDRTETLPLTIGANAEENVVNVYYVKDSFNYTVHYFYDGTEDESKKETLSAVFGSEITEVPDKNITGYKHDRTETLPLTISANEEENVVNVYYVKDSFNYTVHYFYDGTEDTAKKETLSAVFGSEITEVPDKNITGYKHDRTETLPLTISANEEENVVNVYYVKDSFNYTVHYFYDGTEDTAKKETLSAVFGSSITEVPDKNITGYKHDRTETLPLTISANEEENVVNVYYVKDSFNYTVHYFYDGTEDTAKKETLSAVFGSSITEVPDKNITGYKHDRTETLPLTISANEEENVVNVYYVKDSFNYTVHYFYDGTEDTAKKETLSAVFGSEITEVPDKNITGYKKQKTEGLPLTISSNEEENVVNVYYIPDELGYSIHYFYDGIEDEAKVENNNATFGSTITAVDVPDKVITGYKQDRIEGVPLTISANTEDNVINVYYEKDLFEYTVHYFYDNVEDEDNKIEDTALFGSVISEVPDKGKEGYSQSRIETLPLTISEISGENIINVYYTKDIIPDGTVTVEYVDNLTGDTISESTTITGPVGSGYSVIRKTIPGYRLDEENLPDNETGIIKSEPQTVTYKYIELRPYDLVVKYSSGEGETDEAKITVKFGNTTIDEYTTNGELKIADIELTDLGTETYTVYESETPEYCTTVVSEENPAIVELIRRLNTEENKYEFIANYAEIDGFKVIIDEENKKVIFDITAEKNEKYDLAIRKFISKIDNEEITNRIPQVLVSADNMITYVGNDNIEKAKNNQNITYTVRMYNESEVKAKGKQIVERIPEGLVFVPDNEINKQYSWKMYKQGANGEAVEVTNAEEATILVTDYLDGKEIKAFNLDTKEVSYLDVQAVFKVDESKITRQDRIIENTVQITPNENDENTDNDVTTEKVYVQYFDLAVEKYIENVKISINGDETTRTVGYNKKGELVKIDVKNSEAKSTKLTITYGILVKNVGEIPGYATEITDYIPENFELLSNDEWTIDGNKAVSTILSDKLLNPGESTILNITFEWDLAKGSIGTRRNEAEITKYANDYDAEDVTKDNKDGEDILVTLKTGSEAITTVAVIAVFTSILALGVLLIKRKVTEENKH